MVAEPMDVDVKMNMALEDIIAQSGSARKPVAKKGNGARKFLVSGKKSVRQRASGINKPKGPRFSNKQRIAPQLSVKGQSSRRETMKLGRQRFQGMGKRVHLAGRRQNSYVIVQSHHQPQRHSRQQWTERSGYRVQNRYKAIKQGSYSTAGLYQPPAIRSKSFQHHNAVRPRPGSFRWGNSKAKGNGWFGSVRGRTSGQNYLWR